MVMKNERGQNTHGKEEPVKMDQCDSLITKLIAMLLDWYSGDINWLKQSKS